MAPEVTKAIKLRNKVTFGNFEHQLGYFLKIPSGNPVRNSNNSKGWVAVSESNMSSHKYEFRLSHFFVGDRIVRYIKLNKADENDRKFFNDIKEGKLIITDELLGIDRTNEEQEALMEKTSNECESKLIEERSKECEGKFELRNELLAALVLTAIAFDHFMYNDREMIQDQLLEKVALCLKSVELPQTKHFDPDQVIKLVIPWLDRTVEVETEFKQEILQEKSDEMVVKDIVHKLDIPFPLGLDWNAKVKTEELLKEKFDKIRVKEILHKLVLPNFIQENHLTQREIKYVEAWWEYQENQGHCK